MSGERVILLSEKFWVRRFNRYRGVVGRVLTIDDVPYRVVGVLPVRFTLPETGPDVWRVVNTDDPGMRARVQMVVMRNDGITRAHLDGRLKAQSASLQSSGVLPSGQKLVAEEPLPVRLGRSNTSVLNLLLGAVSVLLLVACVNVSNLMLVRASTRSGELALMAAIGAGRGRLLRDAALESLVLAAAGGALGVWLAGGLLDLMLALAPDQISSMLRNTGDLDVRAVVFAGGVTLITCGIFGVLPAWRASRIDPIEALKQQPRAMAGRRDDWWQSTLVSTQVALVVVLLAGAGLLLRSFVKLNQVDLGFNPDRLVSLDVQLTSPRYSSPGAAMALMREVESRVESLLGAPATIAGGSPARSGGFSIDARPEAEGLTPPPGPTYLPSTRVSADFFDVYQIPLVQGRTFAAADGDNAVILNDVMAQRYFGGVSPIGRRFKTDTRQPWLTVVGVARDVKTIGHVRRRHRTAGTDRSGGLRDSRLQGVTHRSHDDAARGVTVGEATQTHQHDLHPVDRLPHPWSYAAGARAALAAVVRTAGADRQAADWNDALGGDRRLARRDVRARQEARRGSRRLVSAHGRHGGHRSVRPRQHGGGVELR